MRLTLKSLIKHYGKTTHLIGQKIENSLVVYKGIYNHYLTDTAFTNAEIFNSEIRLQELEDAVAEIQINVAEQLEERAGGSATVTDESVSVAQCLHQQDGQKSSENSGSKAVI